MTYDHNEVFFAELKGITELDQQNVAPNWMWSLGKWTADEDSEMTDWGSWVYGVIWEHPRSTLGENVKRPDLVSTEFKMAVNICAEVLKEQTFIIIFLKPVYF